MAEEDTILLNIDTQPTTVTNLEETKSKQEEQKEIKHAIPQETDTHIKVEQTTELKGINKSLYFFLGKDNDGPTKMVRSMTDFYLLYEQLCRSFPGVYIPAAPPQSMFEGIETIRYLMEGEKDARFYNEKKYFIQLFCTRCEQYRYIMNSKDFKAFMNYPGEYSFYLTELEQESPIDIAKRMQIEFTNFISNEGESTADMQLMVSYCNKLESFTTKIDALVKLNESFKENLFNSIVEYQKLIVGLQSFESEQLLPNNSQATQLITKNPYCQISTLLKEQESNFITPFKFLEFWSKEEKYELISLRRCYNSISELLQMFNDYIKKNNK